MPLGEGTYFLRSHTSSNSPIIVSHILGIACKTFGHQGACAGTNFIRKLYQTYTSSFDGSTAKLSKDVQDLAEIDAHSYAMATSLHYGLSDFGTGPLIKKSVRAFWTLNQRMPCAAPENDLPDDGFKTILEQLCTRRPNKRTAAEAELDVDEGNDDAGEGADEDDADWPEWGKEDRKAKIIEYGDWYLEQWELAAFKNWMFHQIAEDVWWNEGIDASYYTVRYILKGK